MADLSSGDFLKLLVTQLTNQDPLEPTGNEELLRQISSIREIELSTTMTDSLRSLTGQQRFASASTLIGQHVTSEPQADGTVQRGVVVGIRFDANGQPTVVLSNGVETSLESVRTIESSAQAAESLIGQTVVGLDRRDPSDPKSVHGVVTAVRVDERGEAILELDTGEDLRFRDVVAGATQAAA
jgi:flagellar basal-body rod modification protein FlgD